MGVLTIEREGAVLGVNVRHLIETNATNPFAFKQFISFILTILKHDSTPSCSAELYSLCLFEMLLQVLSYVF